MAVKKKSLSYACMWTEEGWKRITAEEASRLFPEKGASQEALFVCECCREQLVLSEGTTRARSFRHPKGKSDACPGEGEEGGFSLKERALPLRISLTEEGARFELGLPPLPPSLAIEGPVQIRPYHRQPMSVPLPAPAGRGPIWLPLGSRPAPSYHLSAKAPSGLWPEKIRGFREDGMIFEAESGLMVW